MPERSPFFRLPLPRPLISRFRRSALLALVTGAALLGACTEDHEGGAGCPTLCPQAQAPFVDTILDAITFDTTLGPYPVLGLAGGTLLAARGDTLQTYVVIRFDNLPNTFNPNNVANPVPITTIDSTMLRFVIDTTGSRADGPFTIEVFNVDTTESDSSGTVVRSLFRPDRKLGEITVPVGPFEDSLRIPISDAFVAERMINQERLRVGLRIVPTANAQLRIGAFVQGEGAPRLTFDPSSDTTYLPLDVTPRTGFLGAETDDVLRLAYTVYTLTAQDTDPLPPGTLGVGGWPARRAYFRFAIPPAIIDSSTVVRAELLLTQRPAFGPDRGDTTAMQPFIGVTSGLVSDLYLAGALSANGLLAGVDSVRLVPQDSGQRAVNVVNIVRGWSVIDRSVVRTILLRMNGEGSVGTEFRFHDMSAPPALRPRLRITYLPRGEFALP